MRKLRRSIVDICCDCIIQPSNPTSLVDSITNTKAATVLATLGLTLAKPGIFIIYDADNPRSSGGVAHFIFESSLSQVVRRFLNVYNEGVADVALDALLDSWKEKKVLKAERIEELEKAILNALVVYGRKFLDNYQIVAKSLRDDISKFVVTGGTPVFANGKVVGIQNFTLKQVSK